MNRRRKTGWLLVGTSGGIGLGIALLAAVGLFAGTGTAASSAKPENDKKPSISGTAQEGQTLSGDRGTWKNSPTDYDYVWLRCDKKGNDCSEIKNATALQYTLVSADVDHRVKFKVIAKNADGKSSETSDPTDAVKKATSTTTTTTTTTPSRGKGCPSSGDPGQVANISLPAQLIVDGLQSDPSPVRFGTQTLVVRFHVASTCGGPVQGALVYATATPFNQFSVPPETPTGSDGWATLTFQRLSGFPVSGRQRLLAIFVRARKPGESLLTGIAARRLVSVRVSRG
jgi:hypothetical protein